ncbi:MAG: alpha/beta hydrolase fold domain-containing protein [Planctomycetaceae bacterium]
MLSRSMTAMFAVLQSISMTVHGTADEKKPASPFVPDDVVAYRTVDTPDGESDDLVLNIFQPPGHQKTDKRSCIVFFFGGGWNGGNPSQFYPHCEYFASRGMVAISAEYRTKKSHNVEPRTCVFDGKAAIRWVRDHSATIGVHPDRVAAGGGSAGGHVAAAVAACVQLEEAGVPPTTSCIPNALMLFNPVYDNGPEGYGHDRVKSYWEVFSPRHNLHSRMPPTVAFFGTEDKLIPVATTEAFQSAMEAVGVRYDNHLYEGQGHGFFNFGRGSDGTEFFAKTVGTADEFLTSLGLLEGRPAIDEFIKAQPTESARR